MNTIMEYNLKSSTFQRFFNQVDQLVPVIQVLPAIMIIIIIILTIIIYIHDPDNRPIHLHQYHDHDH